MAHGRSYSAPTVTPRAAKRNGMVFTRPFSWSAYLELLPTDSTPAGSSNPSISFQPGNSLHLYTSPPADWSSSSSGSSSCSKPDLWCSGLEPGESGRSHSTVGSGSSTSQAVITPELSPKTEYKAHHQTCPAQAYRAACTQKPLPQPRDNTTRSAPPLSTQTHSASPPSTPTRSAPPPSTSVSPASLSTSTAPSTRTLSLSSLPAYTPPRALSPPPALSRPSLSDLDLVCRTPFLELALSPDLVIRPVRPCERCALHAKECWYEPRTLLPAVEGDTLALPKCACCPDDDGCWHVLGGQMVRPRVAVLDAPQDAMDAMDAAWAV